MVKRYRVVWKRLKDKQEGATTFEDQAQALVLRDFVIGHRDYELLDYEVIG